MKYDVLLDMNSNDSHTIILNQIEKGSKVLEFGSANGKMTKYMKENLACEVYIVEMDQGGFEQACQYSEDGICGDILELEWLRWENIGFDYIIFADVLEHIVCPKEILCKTESLLKDDGVILISIPNITHNDVLIKAFNERFDYTELGILDNTHVHFWGEKNLDEFIEGTPYSISSIDYTIWQTGGTEQSIGTMTKDNKELMDILREREYGEVYQFVFSLVKEKKEGVKRQKKIQGKEYCKIYFDNNNEFYEDQGNLIFPIVHEFKKYRYDFQVEVPNGTKKILIKPTIGKKCVLENLRIDMSSKVDYLSVFSHNINYRNIYCFIDDEPFIILELSELSSGVNIRFSADVVLPGYDFINYICEGCALKMTNEEKNVDIINKFEQVINTIEKENTLLKKQLAEIECVKEELAKLNENDERIVERIAKIENNGKKNTIEIINKIDGIDGKIIQGNENTKEVNRKVSMILDRVVGSVKNGISGIGAKNDKDVAIIASSCYFDWRWYVNKYNLKINSNISAAQHYLNHGWKLYYDPSSYFVTIAYLVSNWDVKNADVNPLLHYEKFGKDEHRSIGNVEGIKEEYNLVQRSKFFDKEWYINKYNIDRNIDAIYYFLLNGLGEYHNPSSHFSSLDYLMDNIHQIGETQNPLVHYERNKNGNKKLIVKEVNEEKANELNYKQCEIVNQIAREELEKYNHKKKEIHKKSVDIIICVYNAYEDVKKCIESVISNTTRPYRIIIVDDNSAEVTASYLRNVAEENSDIKLIRNTSDLHGYTYAANIGLKNSTADYCVMLNSDTIVSEHWLDNMIACAESSEKIGVVGPLSNTASWQSVPKLTDEDGDWCHNVIPKDFTIADVAEMIEKNTGRIYPKVPLLNGFCLLIKREVIDTIGYFDEENFGRGFAEEDDYNTRAVKAGFDLAIADDTYIFHAQSKSYTDEKRLALCKLSGESLRNKHGQEYIDNCSSYMATNVVLDSIRKRVEVMYEKERIYRRCKHKYSGKKILFLLPGSNASGGANVIIQESNALTDMGVDVTILNLESNREEYNKAYGNVKIPVIWLKDYDEFDYSIAKNYDVVVCTLFRTVEYCKFLENYDMPKVAYYIQDYEPYFILEEVKDGDYDHAEYERAEKSYTLIPSCINVTKTQWNSKEVKEHTGAECFVLGPSLNTDLFMPRLAMKKPRVVVTAMIRPNTKRRGPQMTFDVLRKLALEFGDKVSIRIFGADPDRDLYSKLFFAKQKKDFEYINYGLTSPEYTSRILAESDIFLDLSEFQAMGLTAMEAMACGCATIVPKNGGTDCFAQHEKNCLVIDTLNFEECLSNAKRLVIDKLLREKLGQQAYRDMAEMCPEKVAEKFLDVVFSEESRDISYEKN